MVALFVDLDGTSLRHDTNEWLPEVLERLTKFHAMGHQLIFITQRGPHNPNKGLSAEATKELINALPFPALCLTDVQSPRVLIDDVQPFAVHASTNDPAWLKELMK